MALKPLNDNVLVELINDNNGLSLGTDATDSIQKGVVVETPDTSFLSTQSWVITDNRAIDPIKLLEGKTVFWRQYSEKEATFEIDSKTFALIRITDLVAVEEK